MNQNKNENAVGQCLFEMLWQITSHHKCKIFCAEHLADVHILSSQFLETTLYTSHQWLHGPNAEGRCPNCEYSVVGDFLQTSGALVDMHHSIDAGWRRLHHQMASPTCIRSIQSISAIFKKSERTCNKRILSSSHQKNETLLND